MRGGTSDPWLIRETTSYRVASSFVIERLQDPGNK